MATQRFYAIIAIGMMYLIIAAGARKHKSKWRTLGCYKEKANDRVFKYFLGYVRTTNYRRIFKTCRKRAERRKLDYFGIHNKRECWGSDEDGYDKYGCANDCARSCKGGFGVGGVNSNFVYYKMPNWSPCKCGARMQYKFGLEPDEGPSCTLLHRKVYRKSHPSKQCLKVTKPCPVNGGWSKYGPWTACNRICGENGQQKSIRTCTNPEPAYGGKDCSGSFQPKLLSCNSVNCPKRCSYDGVLVQLLNILDPTSSIAINNHLITAFSQVMEAKDRASSLSGPYPSSDLLINKTKDALLYRNTYSNVNRARTLLGVLLARQKDCKYGKVAQDLKDEIGDKGFKKLLNVDGKVTLTFVMDISGKMKTEIKRSTEIARTIAEYKHISDVDYVLSTFSEDASGSLIGEVRSFEKFNEFIKALDNLANGVYHAEKKKNCHQPTYAGIIKGITKGHPKHGSPIYVFTNAPPKPFGKFTKENAIYNAQINKMPVSFFLSKQYSCRKTKSYYKVIARATGGFILTFKRSTMKNIERMIKSSLEGTSPVTSGRVKNKKKYRQKIPVSNGEFDVDDIAEEGTLEVEAEGDAQVKLFNPKKVQMHHEKRSGDSLIWTILRPLKGKWKFKSQSSKKIKFQVNSYTKLNIKFELMFMRGNVIQSHPLIGKIAKVKIRIPNITRLDRNTLSFPDEWVRKSSYDDDSYIYESKAPLKSDSFTITMRGKTLSKSDFTRESVVIQPKIAAISSGMPSPWATKYYEREMFTYEALVDYTGMTPKSFRYRIRISPEDDDIDDDDDQDDDDQHGYDVTTLYHGENKIQQKLIVPSCKSFRVKVTLKSNERRGKYVEINFEDISFDVE